MPKTQKAKRTPSPVEYRATTGKNIDPSVSLHIAGDFKETVFVLDRSPRDFTVQRIAKTLNDAFKLGAVLGIESQRVENTEAHDETPG